MRKIIYIFVLFIIIGFYLFLLFPVNNAYAVLCFKKGEYIRGMNKICIYDCLGSEAAITVKSYQLCPLNINR